MMDVEALATQMFDASFAVLKTKAPAIARYTKCECVKLAHTLASIEEGVAANQVSPDEAAILLDMQRTASRSVLTTAEGLGLLAAEEAINAALDVVRSVVNRALGFALI